MTQTISDGAGAIRVDEATAERWDDLSALMGAGGDPASCWCQFFYLRGSAWSSSTPTSNRAALREQVRAGERPPGLLASVGDEPAGWGQIGPKESFPRLAASPITRAPRDAPDPENTWAITCFVVASEHRRRGVATALLHGALRFAERAGASVVEGYPVDTAGARMPSAELFHGTVGQFQQAGFTEVRRPTPRRAVMRRALSR